VLDEAREQETDLGDLADRDRLALVAESEATELGVVAELLEADRLRRLDQRNDLLALKKERARSKGAARCQSQARVRPGRRSMDAPVLANCGGFFDLRPVLASR
jgi:hypothetical protein